MSRDLMICEDDFLWDAWFVYNQAELLCGCLLRLSGLLVALHETGAVRSEVVEQRLSANATRLARLADSIPQAAADVETCAAELVDRLASLDRFAPPG